MHWNGRPDSYVELVEQHIKEFFDTRPYDNVSKGMNVDSGDVRMKVVEKTAHREDHILPK